MTSSTTTATPRRLRVGLPLAAAVLVGLVAALLSPLSAQAAIALGGTVQGPTGTAMSALKVEVVRTGDGTVAKTVTTSATGAFTVTGLTADQYTLRFPATATTYPQHLGGSSALADARVLDLTDPQQSFIRATLSAGGKVTGTAKTGSKAVSGATVTVYQAKDDKWISVRTATTSSKGVYTITGLEPGSYRLQARKTGLAPVFSGGAASILAATDVGVTANGTTTTNFAMGSVAKVSGVVRGDDGFTVAPLAGVVVTAWRYVGPKNSNALLEELPITATTNASGAYTLTGLTPGDYTLYFEAPATSDVGSSFLGSQSVAREGTTFVVGSGSSLTGRDITLRAAGSISGLLRVDATTTPIPNVRVTLLGDGEDADDPLSTPRTTLTAADGTFEFERLGEGTYTLVFGAFDAATPGEDTSWARRSWGTIDLNIGEDETPIIEYTSPRPPMVPDAGDLPHITIQGGGSWKVGEFVRTEFGTWPSSGYVSTGEYRWYRDGVRIPGVTGFQYTLRPGDLGRTITSEFTKIDWAYGSGTYRTDPTPTVVLGDAPTVLDIPTYTGLRQVGHPVTVDEGRWEVIDNSGFSDGQDLGILWSYQWQRSPNGTTWTDISGATARTFIPTAAEENQYVRVVLDGQRWGYADIVDYEAQLFIADTGLFYVLPGTSGPKITSTKTTWGVSLNITPTPATVLYNWEVADQTNTMVVSGSNPTFPRAGTAGKKVTLGLILQSPGMADAYYTLVAQSGGASTATGSLALTGTARVGSTLTSPALTWQPMPDSLSYQWQRLTGTKWANIAGATASTYEAQPADVSKRVRVIVKTTTLGFASGSRTSTQSAVIAPAPAPAPFVAMEPTLMGAAVNTTATVNNGMWDQPGLTFSYAWRHRATPSGAATAITNTGATYKVPNSLLGRYLEVVVTAKKPGFATATYTIPATQVMVGQLVNTVAPKVTNLGGTLYRVNSGTWSPAHQTVSHTWIARTAAGSEVSLWGGDEFDPSATAANRPLWVQTTAAKGGWASGVIRVKVKNGVFVPLTAPGISGTMKSGSTMTAHAPNFSNPPDGYTLNYQWQLRTTATTWTNIAGATQSTFVPGSAQFGKSVRVRVTASAPDYTSLVLDSAGATVTLGDALTAGSESFSSAPTVGVKTTALPGAWSQPGVAFTYQWQGAATMGDPWVNIAGATAASYTPPGPRAYQPLRVVITGKKPGFADGQATIDVANILPGTLTVKTAGKLTKSTTTVTATAPVWNVATTATYDWQSMDSAGNQTQIGTTRSIPLSSVPAGSTVFVTVYGDAAGYTQNSVNLFAQLGPAVAPLSSPTISGTREVGDLLQVSSVDWAPWFASPSYQWLRNGQPIPSATGPLYAPQSGDVGKTVSVKITATAFGRPTFTSTFAAGLITTNTAPSIVTRPVLTVPGGGEARVGATLSTSAGTWSETGLSFGYQWYRDEAKIPGATAATYVLQAADLGASVSAVVTATKPGWRSATARTAVRTVLEGAAPVLTGAPLAITQSAGTLQTSTLVWNLPSTVTYQWESSPNSMSTFTPIPGATAQAISITGLGGLKVRLVVTATRPGHPTTTLTSNEVLFL